MFSNNYFIVLRLQINSNANKVEHKQCYVYKGTGTASETLNEIVQATEIK